MRLIGLVHLWSILAYFAVLGIIALEVVCVKFETA